MPHGDAIFCCLLYFLWLLASQCPSFCFVPPAWSWTSGSVWMYQGSRIPCRWLPVPIYSFCTQFVQRSWAGHVSSGFYYFVRSSLFISCALPVDKIKPRLSGPLPLLLCCFSFSFFFLSYIFKGSRNFMKHMSCKTFCFFFFFLIYTWIKFGSGSPLIYTVNFLSSWAVCP